MAYAANVARLSLITNWLTDTIGLDKKIMSNLSLF